MKKFLSFLIALGVSSCAYDSEDKISAQNQQFQERREQLLKIYRPLEGVYSGKLKAKKSLISSQPVDVPARFVISIQEREAGTDPTGQTAIMPFLRMVFYREDYPAIETPLIAHFLPESDNQISASSMAATIATDEIASFSGTITATELKGTVQFGNNSTGEVFFKKNALNTTAQTSSVSINEEIIKQYKRIEGVYEGTVIPDLSVPLPIGSPARKSFKMLLHVNVGLSAANQPFIKGFYSREESETSNGGLLSQEMVGNFKTETVPERIVFSNPSLAAGGGVVQNTQVNTGRSSTNDYFLNIEGIFLPAEIGANGRVLQEARIVANYLTLRNYVGRVELVRIKSFSKEADVIQKQ